MLDRRELDAAIYDGFWGLLGLCALLDILPGYADASLWRETIRNSAEQALLISRRNPWGLAACYWYKDDPGGGIRAGSACYKYFPRIGSFIIGNNLEILAKALFLIRCARYADNGKACIAAACRQVDWVFGLNPFNSSTVEGVGRNQPQRLINVDEFIPPTPQIPGAVMTGIGACPGDDIPEQGRGCTAEYDLPPTSMLIWVLKELSELES